MDACRVGERLPGCEHVKVLYRRGPDEIPARKDELEGAIAEAIEFVYNVQPVGVAGRDGGLALRCVRTELGEPGQDGRRRPSTSRAPSTSSPAGSSSSRPGRRPSPSTSRSTA